MLKCANGKYYVGSTNNLRLRLDEHENGVGAQFTKAHKPFELVYLEEFDRIDDAFNREQQLKGWSRAKKEALIGGDMNRLHGLSECKNDTKAGSCPSAPLRNREDRGW